MDNANFLRAILPTQGLYFAARRTQYGWKHVAAYSIEQINNTIIAADSKTKDNIYYAMSSFAQLNVIVNGETKQRVQTNVAFVKSFWIDIDVGKGEKRGYNTREEALIALKQTYKTIGLPRPLVVDSGNGFHAYWPIDQDMTQAEWHPVAMRLRVTLLRHGLRADYGCTTDAARVLRPVGTMNKNASGNYKPVRQLCEAARVMPLDDFAACLDQLHTQVPSYLTGEQGLTMPTISDPRPSSIRGVVAKCQLMNKLARLGGNVSEPLWHKTLGLVKFTTEGEKAIHFFSNKHPEYSESQTIAKADAWKVGPPTCATLEVESTLEIPNGCQGCPHRGKITVPLVLGYASKLTTEPPPQAAQPTAEVAQPLTHNVLPTLYDKTMAPALPDLPDGLRGKFRWHEGTLQMYAKDTVRDDDGNETSAMKWIPFCRTLIHPIGYFSDDEGKDRNLWSKYGPNGYEEFVLDGGDIGTGGAKLFTALGENGIFHMDTPQAKKAAEIFVRGWADLNKTTATEANIFDKFGWHGDRFVIGDRMYTPDGKVEQVRIAGAAKEYIPYFEPKGSLERWKELVNEAYNRPGSEAFQFLVGAAVGSILMPFTNVGGGVIINAFSQVSGRGKTTAIRAGFGVWGDPSETGVVTTSHNATTGMAKYLMAGLLNNLPLVVDEVTNRKGIHVSEDAYLHSQGQPRQRLRQGGEFAERGKNWSCIQLSSSNASAHELLSAAKLASNAEIKRIIEITMDGMSSMPKQQADRVFAELRVNYGYAGHEFLKHVVANKAEVLKTLNKVREYCDKLFQFKQEDRFWSAGYACAITALYVMKKLGMIAFDIDKLINWCGSDITKTSATINELICSPGEMLARMISDLSHGFISTDRLPTGDTDIVTAKFMPITNDLNGRLVLNTCEIYIPSGIVRKWAAENNVSVKILVKTGIELGYIKSNPENELNHYAMMAVGAGTLRATSRERCYVIDAKAMGAQLAGQIGISHLVEKMEANGLRVVK